MSLPKTITHLLPTGAIILWGGGADMPTGFLLCNGASVNRSDYPDLAEALGETGTTFSLPDYRDRVPQGAGTVSPSVEIEAGLPQFSGGFTCRRGYINNFQSIVAGSSGGMTLTDYEGEDGMYTISIAWGDNRGRTSIDYKGSASNSIYGSASTVQPPAIAASFLIKI